MTTITLHEGDNRVALQRMIDNGEFVDSVVCDPPYGLVSVTKRFGATGAAPAKHGTDGAFTRQSRGFMGKIWDGTGIERDPEFWSLVYQVMKPGAYIVAFSSSRTYGYMQVAMEAAGFITHPMFGWVFNTGFPKGHDVGKAIDKTVGVEGAFEATGDPVKRMIPGADQDSTGSWIKTDDREYQPGSYTPGSDEGRQWHGWKTGTQSLKPALEPVYFGQKPFSEKTGALNVLKHGVGAVNVDACRVATGDAITATRNTALGRMNDDAWQPQSQVYEQQAGGRYPANLIHDGSDDVVALFPQSAGQLAPVKGTEPSRTGGEGTHCYGEYADRLPAPTRGDSGSAARFFNSFPHEGPILCHPKAGKVDRAGSKHATVKPIALMQHFIRLITPLNGTVLDPFGGSGTTGQAALNEGMSCILMEAEAEYAADIRRRFGLGSAACTAFDDLLG